MGTGGGEETRPLFLWIFFPSQGSWGRVGATQERRSPHDVSSEDRVHHPSDRQVRRPAGLQGPRMGPPGPDRRGQRRRRPQVPAGVHHRPALGDGDHLQERGGGGTAAPHPPEERDMARSKDAKFWNQVLKEVQAQGLTVERPGERRNKDGSKKKGGRHIRVSNPETGDFCFVSSTPSDYRGILNEISWMRRKVGFTWKGH